MTTGSDRLKQAIARFRQSSPTSPPIHLQPSTALEALILERITALQADVAALQDQQRWLIRLTAGAILGAVITTILQ